MEMSGYARILRQHWRLVVICTLAAIAVGWFTAPAPGAITASSQRYQATATLIQDKDQDPQSSNLGLASYLATAGDVPRIAAEALASGDDPNVLRQSVTAEVNPDLGTLTISAVDLDRDRAVAVAEAFANATMTFLVQDGQAELDAQLAEAQQELDAITSQMASLEDDIASAQEEEEPVALLTAQLAAVTGQYQAAYGRVRDLSSSSSTPSSGLEIIGTTDVAPVDGTSLLSPPTKPVPRMLLFGLLGLGLGLVAALAMGRLDTRLRTRAEAEDAFGATVLAEIPRMKLSARRSSPLVVHELPHTPDAESYRTLRSALRLAGQQALSQDGHAPSVVLVTSVRSGDGKSTTIANLATALAEAGYSVLVIDSDFRNPRMHEYLDAMPGTGLRELLSTPGHIELSRAVRATAVPGVRLLTNGAAEAQPASLLMRLDTILAQARRMADIVLIDSAPLLIASETLDIAQNVDAALVVCRSGRTSIDGASELRKLLARAGTPVLGVVLAGVQRPAPNVIPRTASSSSPRRRSAGPVRPGSPRLAPLNWQRDDDTNPAANGHNGTNGTGARGRPVGQSPHEQEE